MRGSRLTAVLTAAVIALSACGFVPSSMIARVPTTGPIEQGEQVAAPGDDQFIRVIARGPRPGMTAPEIVRGFLDASASFDGDFAVAREYLTPAASQSWQPAAGVLVYEGIGSLEGAGSTVTLSGIESGRISATGHYAVAAPGTELRADFTLASVNGELRISRAPDGLVLSLADVDRSFRPQSIYFFDPGFATLVPDPRMLPYSRAGQATALVRALIAGPSAWLAPAVRTGFASGVGLAVDSVPVENGVALVDLTRNALLASDEVRQALSAQLVWTLRQVPDVTAVSITAAGQPLPVPGVSSPQSVEAWPGANPDAFAPTAGAYALVDGVVVRLLDDAAPTAFAEQEIPLTAMAIAPGSDAVAGTDAQGRLWRSALDQAAVLEPLSEQPGWSAPAFDRSGDVWAVDDQGVVAAVRPDGTVSPIAVTGLPADARVRAVVPARDGTRAAILVRQGPATSLMLGRVVRSTADGTVEIQRPLRVESALADVVVVAWSSAATLAVIASVEASPAEIFTVDVARGLTSAIGSPEQPESLTAAPGRPLLVASKDGWVFRAQSGVWQAVIQGSAPAYPG